MSKTNSTNGHFTTRRLVFDAVLIALFFVLSISSLRIGNTFKISFASLPIVVAAMMFGPVDGFIVGFVGELLSQMLTYGFTATTILWMLDPAARGLIIGIACILLKQYMRLDRIVAQKQPYVYFLIIALSSFAASTLNTLALYVDSKMFGYYEYHMVFGVYFVRIGTGMVSSLLMGAIAIPILVALKKTKVVEFA